MQRKLTAVERQILLDNPELVIFAPQTELLYESLLQEKDGVHE